MHKMPLTRAEEQEAALILWDLCKKFIHENQISCPETIGQMDHVIVNAYDFIEEICDIVGYEQIDEDT